MEEIKLQKDETLTVTKVMLRLGHASINCKLPQRCVKCSFTHVPGECTITASSLQVPSSWVDNFKRGIIQMIATMVNDSRAQVNSRMDNMIAELRLTQGSIVKFANNNTTQSPNPVENGENYLCDCISLQKILSKLPNKTSSGPNNIPPLVFKKLPPKIIEALKLARFDEIDSEIRDIGKPGFLSSYFIINIGEKRTSRFEIFAFTQYDSTLDLNKRSFLESLCKVKDNIEYRLRRIKGERSHRYELIS
ncbi:hypothetical protein PV325_000312 [Microctonus aethiopoides]|nr:hypothetical protein PV325_000312 [Microctonus aethiopoides]